MWTTIEERRSCLLIKRQLFCTEQTNRKQQQQQQQQQTNTLCNRYYFGVGYLMHLLQTTELDNTYNNHDTT